MSSIVIEMPQEHGKNTETTILFRVCFLNSLCSVHICGHHTLSYINPAISIP